ncbi:MAG TPA: GntR family transcriptional regulator [Planctomycetaceae bacterium]
MAFDLSISTGSSVPIFRQIVDQVRCAVANGTLAVGDRLPSVRALAERLVVNHNTVAKAYNDLVRDGVIESRHGLGVFVARRRAIYTKAERVRRLEAALEAFLSEALVLDFSHEEIRLALLRKLEAAMPSGVASHA